MFKPVSQHTDFPEMEKEILRFWEEKDIFAQSLAARKGDPEFIFYDGPPFATGLPHYGHLLAGTIKDVIPRYQTMCGKYCERTFGWDCHGLPVEYEMEKQLKLSGKREIEDYGVDRFNEACRGIVLRYTAEWESIVKRMGRWVDFRNGYRTMDTKYMESIWWVFRQLWEKGLIYEGYKILPYCARCSTPLSNFEANQGYREVVDPCVTVRFQVKELENTYILAWTTTPWTLPSNMALAVGPDIEYVKIADDGVVYILAEARVPVYYGKEKPQIIGRCTGKELAGLHYEPLFPYFADYAEKGAFRVIPADYVSTEDGTGIVHIAPEFGEDDSIAGKANGVPGVCPIDAECRFTAEVSDYAGRFVKDTDKDIMQRLKEEGRLIQRGTVRHSYPHCWRDDSPLIYKAVSTWFVRIDPIKQKMLNANAQMSWVPAHIKEGRFGKWLANARDWAISRNRYWGCPLPVWRCEETGETICVGSVAELERLSGQKITDIHKHFVDKIEIRNAEGHVFRRVPEVLDCWFESGSMPYAQKHYPFEDKEHFESVFPADFIAEGLDQTRGWFYTLVVLAAALFDKPPAKNVVVNGLVLAENGQKMSKRLKNYPDPMEVVGRCGADALRLFLLESQVVRAEDLKFSEEGVREVVRSVILPVWNSFSFFVTYANVDGWEPPARGPVPPADPANALDRWILSSLEDMVVEIRNAMDSYQLQRAANRFETFAENLTNWYIRLSRRRFWKSGDSTDKAEAYATLYYVLLTFTKAAAPFIPFLTEHIYRVLRTPDMPESVHLCDFPAAGIFRRDPALERQMALARQAVTLGRFLRTQRTLKVRQPLAWAIAVSIDPEARELLEKSRDLIAEELNVKKVEILADEEELVHLSAKANFKKLGARLGARMKEAASAIAALPSGAVAGILSGKSLPLALSDGTTVDLVSDDITVVREEKEGICVAAGDGITLALDTALSEPLIREGIAREIVSRIQNMRKESGLEVQDRIRIVLEADDAVRSAAADFQSYIAGETLADSMDLVPAGTSGKADIDINGHNCRLQILTPGTHN